jgi:hypothetical protein
MALYQNGNELTHEVSSKFDQLHNPGSIAPFSGIYICANCRDEDACNAGDPLPPQNHRQHNPVNGAVQWKLLIQTQRGPNP